MTRKALWAIPAMLLLAASTAMADNLVVNGGFETGNFSGWTLTGNTGHTSVVSTTPFGPCPEGRFCGRFGQVGALGFLSQSVATVAGKDYTFSFDLANSTASLGELFSASWDGTSRLHLVNRPSFHFTEYSFTVVGTGHDTLSFSFRHDPQYWFLDAVSVTPKTTSVIPEPSSLSLLGSGVLVIAGSLKRRIKK